MPGPLYARDISSVIPTFGLGVNIGRGFVVGRKNPGFWRKWTGCVKLLAQRKKEKNVLFLVDEILQRNELSRSPHRDAEAVVRYTGQARSNRALSTHDLALTEIAASGELQGMNVHMSSRGFGDPMDFDYRLKPGVTNETNALAIARMAGVPV